LALGAVLMLGGVTGGRGDELSGSVGMGDAPSSGGFMLPTLPENWADANWADMPFRLTASENVSYNNNIFALPAGESQPGGGPRGDFTSTSSFGLSTTANWFGQQVFFDGSYGVIRYLHQVASDGNVFTINSGVNWTLTSRCSGALAASVTRAPTLITAQVGTGINYSTSTALSETGKCAVSGGYSLVFDGSLTQVSNSNGLNGLNNSRTDMFGAGIEYASGPDSLTGMATVSDTNYSNRGAVVNTLGLANTVIYHNFNLTYVRQIDADLSLNAQVGLVGVTNASTLDLPKTLLPTYSFAATWAITPKLALTASVSRSVAPPTTVLANAQTSYDAIVTLAYQATPKITVSANASTGYTNGAFTPGLAGTAFAAFVANTDYYSAQAQVSYAMTPFISAALSATVAQRVSDHIYTPQDVITLSLNYRPQ
jgi:hypothetical protein